MYNANHTLSELPTLNINSIGFDAKRAVLNYSGLGNYSRLVLELIANRFPTAEMRLFTPKVKENRLLQPILQRPNVSIETPDTIFGRMFGSLWRSRGMTSQIKRFNPDLFHGLSNQLPVGIDKTGIPSLVTIHDVIFIPHPEFYHRPDVEIYKRHFHRSANLATRVMAISECTKRDLIHYFNIPEEKIDIVYQGCDNSFYMPVTKERLDDVRKRYALPERYIVGVGTIERRKNQLLAVKALPSLPSDISLVLVGRPTDYVKEIQKEATRLGVSDRLKLIHGADFKDFPAFYSGAILSSYPSHYEGFGIPVIESIASGTPVVAATGSCLEEAGGPGALYVTPQSTDEFIDAARAIISDTSLRDSLVANGQKYIKRFSAENFTKGLLDSYARTLGS